MNVEAGKEYEEIGIYCFGRGIFRKRPRSGLEVGDKDLYLLKEGDFILQVTFAWEGAIAIVSKAEDGLFGSTRYPTFRVDEERCDPRFLLHYFKTHAGLDQLIRICPGSAGRNRVLSIKRIPEVMIPLPPLAEQRRVVARIEELAAQIHEARTLRQQASADCAALLRAILRSGSTTLTPMSELVTLRAPNVVVERAKSYQFAGVYSFGRGVFKANLKSGADFAYPKLSRLSAGDFVYPKLMAWEGAFGVTPQECDGFVVSTEFPVFEVHRDRVLPEVLDVYFRDPSVWESVAGTSIGTNARRRRLNPAEFLDYSFQLPSRATQILLAKVSQEIDALKRHQAETAAELDALLPAILDRAFKGELLPPASVDLSASVYTTPDESAPLLAAAEAPSTYTVARPSLEPQRYFIQLIPALLRAVKRPLALDQLNAAVALLFLPDQLLPLVAATSGPAARAHFESFPQANRPGAFRTAMQFLARAGTLQPVETDAGIVLRLNPAKTPPIAPPVETDARHLAAIIDLVPSAAVKSKLKELQPRQVREALLVI